VRDANAYANGHTDGDAYADGDADGDAHADANGHTHRDAFSDAHLPAKSVPGADCLCRFHRRAYAIAE
jgi:hypothetical protein